MNEEVFQKWFQNILPEFEPVSVIVMDNAPYHSVNSIVLQIKRGGSKPLLIHYVRKMFQLMRVL
jgi:hypothetical protein